MDIIQLIEKECEWLERIEESLFHEVTILTEGMSFGELALNSGQKRAATILCKTDCHFAVMNKADYEKCLLITAKKNMQLALEFLRSLPFIGNTCTRTQLVKLKLQMEQKTFKRHQPAAKEGEKVTTFFIVRSGEFVVTKR